MAVAKRRVHIYTAADVASHTSQSDCWVSRDGKVYNLSPFLSDHPGGADLLLAVAGKDLSAPPAKDGGLSLMDEDHEHSDFAYEMLEEYAIGRLGNDDTTVDEDWVATDDFQPENTDCNADFEKNQFLDLRRPLLRQVWEANFSKSYYMQQVHQPRHLANSARMFGPDYLEVFSRAAWYVVPLFWLPITVYLLLRSLLQFGAVPLPSVTVTLSPPFSTLSMSYLRPITLTVPTTLPVSSLAALPASAFYKTMACFFTGNLLWTILEYTLHRFLFHVDAWLPDRPVFLTLHFMLHGIHHYLPMDRLRLVMPPVLFGALQTPFTRFAHAVLPPAVANGIISGIFTFYVMYDCMHYALHHTALPAYMKEMKKHHLAHHYKNFELGFGVTSRIWDIVFNTLIPI
ncbi:hypothetical protein PLICRDRAFT_51769 [Plicaturopsis crispa FD-325 SS-3]|nr:hypothetical protein PLICRDRAFT_51769 [Plicaturopsis crispa FD-325 SS-3]